MVNWYIPIIFHILLSISWGYGAAFLLPASLQLLLDSLLQSSPDSSSTGLWDWTEGLDYGTGLWTGLRDWTWLTGLRDWTHRKLHSIDFKAAHTLLHCSILTSRELNSGKADGHHSISMSLGSFSNHFCQCVCYANNKCSNDASQISTGHYPTAVL